MKGVFFFAICGLLVMNASAQQTIIHDPNAELRQVKGFHAIEVSNAINLYLSQGDQETVVVSAINAKWRDHIRTEVKDGVLKVWLDVRSGWGWEGNNKKLKAYISFTMLDRLSASGASNVYVDGVISGNSLELGLSGASNFKGAVHLNALSLDQSGASDALITGSVANLTTIHASGASDLKGYDLSTETCDAHVSGASDIHITVDKELSAHATGASSVHYRGNAVIKELHSSGASSVSKKG
jgi:hypothetical protein